MVIKAVGNDDFSMFDIDLQDFTSKKMDIPQHLARRIHDRREIQVAGCHFVKHRREPKEGIAIDEGDLDGGIPSQSLLSLPGDGETCKTAAEHKDPFWYGAA